MLDLTGGQLFGLVVAAVAAVVAGRLAGAWAHRVLYRRVLISRASGDDRVVLRLAPPLEALGIVAVWQLLVSLVGPPAAVLAFCRAIGHIGLLFALAWGAIRVVDTFVEIAAARVPHMRALLPLARRITQSVFAVVAGVMILSTLGYAIGPLLVVLAIAGGALALAAHRPLENVIAAFALLGDHGIREGDSVRLEHGVTGTIEAIGLYSTRLRTVEGSHVIVPNRALADAQIERAFSRPATHPHAAVPPPPALTNRELS